MAVVNDETVMHWQYGCKLRFNKFSIRGGYNKTESPYKELIEDSSSLSYGIGYDFGSTIINLSHKSIDQNRNHQLFDSGLTDKAFLESSNLITSLSIIFKF